MAEHHLEAVIIGRVVAARDHDPAADVEHAFRIIKHRRRPEPDADRIDAALAKAPHYRRLQHRRAFAAIAPDRDLRAARIADQSAEAPADRISVIRTERLSDDPPYVIFAQRGR